DYDLWFACVIFVAELARGAPGCVRSECNERGNLNKPLRLSEAPALLQNVVAKTAAPQQKSIFHFSFFIFNYLCSP
ncbi:MAG: hypothetical protein K2I62_01690, partial [Alistipes sp.]|nr:hypothetical protein [Alistipes sp.]